MLVRVGNRIVDSRQEPILLIMTEDEIERIATVEIKENIGAYFTAPENYPPMYAETFCNILKPRLF